MTEVPWPDALLRAKLVPLPAGSSGPGEAQAWLHFLDPNGARAAVPVRHDLGPDGGSTPQGVNLWSIRVDDDEAVVSPSILMPGHWHSPKPVRFHLVDNLRA